MTIRFRTLSGQTVERLNHGERKALILASLAAKPWQTRDELGRGATTIRMEKLMAQGLVQKRRGTHRRNGKVGFFPFEYALKGTP